MFNFNIMFVIGINHSRAIPFLFCYVTYHIVYHIVTTVSRYVSYCEKSYRCRPKCECFYWPEECETVCRSSFANENIVFLICLMFIFERPIQISLFRIHLVSVIKCVTCQVRFWINYWRAWMDKQRQHSLRYLPDFTQQYFSRVQCSIGRLWWYEMFETAECAVSSDFKRPRVWIDI